MTKTMIIENKKPIYKNEDFTNKKLGEYTVVGYDHTKFFDSQTNGVDYWLVKCSCGEEKTLSKWKLVHGEQIGCIKCSKVRFSGPNNHHWNSESEHVTGMYFRKMEAQAKKRNLKVEITRENIDELFKKQNGLCAYTGLQLLFADSTNRKNTASLDRIDSNKGYSIDNIQWVHKDINMIKMDMSHEQFLEMCNLVTNYEKRNKD